MGRLLRARRLGLQRVETAVDAVVGDEFVVAADLDDASFVHHDDAVGVAHRGQAMRDYRIQSFGFDGARLTRGTELVLPSGPAAIASWP